MQLGHDLAPTALISEVHKGEPAVQLFFELDLTTEDVSALNKAVEQL